MTRSKNAGAAKSGKPTVAKTPSVKRSSQNRAAKPAKPVKPAKTASGAGGTTKLATLVGLMSAKGGASIEELCAATGWQAHSVRGAIAGALKNRGHHISSEKHDGVRRYHCRGRS